MRGNIFAVVLLLAARGILTPPYPAEAVAAESETRRLDWCDKWSYQGEVRPSAGAMGRMVPKPEGGFACYYEGEVEPRRGGDERRRLNPWGPICTEGYCAHGYGDLGTDASWGYKGAFVDGLMHGRGTYWTDFYDYDGGFEHDAFDGDSVLTCLDGRKFEGVFDDGRMTGEFQVTAPGGQRKTERFSEKPVGWVGPC
jgi:hypothetical protein